MAFLGPESVIKGKVDELQSTLSMGAQRILHMHAVLSNFKNWQGREREEFVSLLSCAQDNWGKIHLLLQNISDDPSVSRQTVENLLCAGVLTKSLTEHMQLLNAIEEKVCHNTLTLTDSPCSHGDIMEKAKNYFKKHMEKE